MLGTQSIREHEYAALMSRARDVARTSLLCWTAASVTSAVLLAGALSARSPGLMLPAVLCAAFGFYLTLRSRREARLIEGYVQETYEKDRDGAQWFTRLSQLQAIPASGLGHDWLPLAQANAVTLLAVVFAWVFASAAPRGELMASFTTMAGVAFAVHSLVQQMNAEQAPSAAYWNQLNGGLREVPPATRRAA